MRRLLTALLLALAMAIPSAVQAHEESPWGIPIPIPGGGSGGSFPIPVPVPQGGGGVVIDIPIPSGGVLRIPIPGPASRRSPQPAPLPAPRPEPPVAGSGGQPSGYAVLTLGGRVARVRPQDLPLRVHSTDSRYDAVLARAVDVWNQAGYSLGQGQLFAVVVSPGQADVPIEWRALGGNAAGATEFRRSSRAMTPVRVTVDPRTSLGGNLAEVLIHELGHVLGLDHSESAEDIMAAHTHRHHHYDVSEAQLSSRDMQALRWLYAQADYAPIVPRGFSVRQAKPGRRGW